jgi:hypothetical protein
MSKTILLDKMLNVCSGPRGRNQQLELVPSLEAKMQ